MQRKVYLDHAATAPLESAVLKAILPYLCEEFGNPASLYALGRRAKLATEKARLQIAKALRCEAGELIFTATATEADNLALAGIARAHVKSSDDHVAGKIIISAVEHKGVSSICNTLKKEGFEIVRLPVDKFGVLDLGALKRELNEKTILVSVTMADSETGTLQPIREIAKIISEFKTPNSSLLTPPYFHTDATQAFAYEKIDVKKLGVDLLTISAHKLGGPKGIAALYVHKGVRIEKPHSGTVNVPAIVGFGKAVELNEKRKKVSASKIRKLRDQLETNILNSIPKTLINGHRKKRLPNFLNVSILDVEGEAMLLYLDELGIQVSTGSACDAENLKPSAVLTAHGNPYEFIHGSLRFTLGHRTTSSDIKYVLKILPGVVEKLRKISPLDLKV